jgi:hypothetical protein
MKIISLGWGVQSFTLAAMVALGELEPVDYAIHADTTHENNMTYDFAKRLTPWLEERGVKVVTVKPKHTNPLDNGYGHEDVPFYTLSILGKSGQGKRQCTTQWKIYPMRRYIRAHRNGEKVEQWIGISLDEFKRMKESDVKYITNRWPLIEKRMTRQDCATWLEKHDLEVPAKSACYFCPYHSRMEWRNIQSRGDGDWEKAVALDYLIRKAHPPYDLFLHPSRKPIEMVDFRTAEEKGQMSLWDNECSGMRGL